MFKKRFASYLRSEEIVLSDLEKSLLKHEGFKPKYHLVKGVLHFGIGHNCEDNPLTKDQDSIARFYTFNDKSKFAIELLRADINEARKQVSSYFFSIGIEFSNLSSKRIDALIEMVFQLGIGNFRKFKNTIGFINANLWAFAQIEAKDSKWYRNHKKRATKVLKGFLS